MLLAHRGFRMNDYTRHIVHTLKSAGYHSVLAGLQHVAPEPGMIGYDEIISPRNASARNVAPVAVEFLNRSHSQRILAQIAHAGEACHAAQTGSRPWQLSS